jgi:gliding motility-associated-like protein
MTITKSTSSDGGYNVNCAGGKTGSIDVLVHNKVGSVDYMWIDGFIGKNRTDLSAGKYKIILNDSNNCKADSTIILTEPEKIKLDFDITEPFCPEKPDGEIRLTVSGGISENDYVYKWFDNSTLQNISNIPAGSYRVSVTDMNGCSVKDSIRLNGLNEICLIIPEAFSPNHDLINDYWNMGNTDLYPQMEVTILNRWGQTVWYSENGYPVPWDGRSNGKALPVDSYHYVINLYNGLKPIVGTITIIR